VAALAVQPEHLDRPRADAGDRTQPPPALLVLAAVQIDAPARDLARRAHERERAGAGELEGLEQRRRGPRQHLDRGQVAQAPPHPVPVVAAPSQRG
jgi:hypothetical protein